MSAPCTRLLRAWRRDPTGPLAAASCSFFLFGYGRGPSRANVNNVPSLGGASSLPYTTAPEEMGFSRAPRLADDISLRQCRSEALSFGKRAGRLTCMNPTPARQRVHIPRGYMFQPDDPGMQTLICEKEVDFMIEPGTSTVQEFDAFCGFSKGRIPRGGMRASGLVAPAEVLKSQSDVWNRTRPFERVAPKPGGMKSLWSTLSPPRQAAEEKQILQKSYGMNDAQYTSMVEQHKTIDKNPTAHQFKAGRSGARLRRTAGNSSGTVSRPAAPPGGAGLSASSPSVPAGSGGAAPNLATKPSTSPPRRR